jgi:hypothetical protein
MKGDVIGNLLGERIRNLGTNLGIHWELDEKTLGTKISHATATSPIRKKETGPLGAC